MNPDEMKEVQRLQELLTEFNADSSFIRVENVKIFETGDTDAYIGKLEVGGDGEVMLFTQNKKA